MTDTRERSVRGGHFAVYRRVGHRTVAGWLKPQVLDLLAALSAAQTARSVSGGIAEIGVHHGRLFIGLHLLLKPDEKSLAVDLFADQAMNIDRSGLGDEQIFVRNVVRHAGSADGMTVLSTNSLQIDGRTVRENLDGGARFFSVDGGHTSETVEHDMRTAQDSLVDGGVVIADDVFNESWPGVVEGTFRYLDDPAALVPFAIGFNKVLLTQREFADEYRQVMIDMAETKALFHKASTMHGEQVEVLSVPTTLYRLRRVPALRRPYHLAKRAYGSVHRR